MAFYRRHWYEVGIYIFVALAFIMGLIFRDIDPLRRILIYSFMALLIHQFEEYALPGGFAVTYNYGFFNEKERYDRHPLCAQSCLWINVFFAYPFYIIAIIFPKVIWLGLAQVFFGMIFQGLAHIFILNIRCRTFYNPGMGAVVCFNLTIGIYYIWYVVTNGLVSGGIVFLWGFLGMLGGIVLTLVIPLVLWSKVGKEIPLSPEEVARFHVIERIDRRRPSKED